MFHLKWWVKAMKILETQWKYYSYNCHRWLLPKGYSYLLKDLYNRKSVHFDEWNYLFGRSGDLPTHDPTHRRRACSRVRFASVLATLAPPSAPSTSLTRKTASGFCRSNVEGLTSKDKKNKHKNLERNRIWIFYYLCHTINFNC